MFAHGFLWGLCYAPLFAVAGDLLQSLAYIVTSCLTICAGLPFLLIGEPSRFSATFEPPGWLPLAAVILSIAAHRPWRMAIAIPWRRMPEHVN